ncbi:MAG: HDOD domain-containing protein [Gemmatimonadaceae bacterium]|nr:HDOD domain-containing protein [Gemmatimonadaceae bacterium]
MPYIFPRLQQIISRGEDLPTLPAIVLQLHSVLDDPKAGAAKVSRLIEQDPALTTRLLRLSNSAHFGRPGPPVTSVQTAVKRMGLNQVRAVCLVLAVVKAFGNGRARFDHEEFWSHSATVASLASRLWEWVGDTRVIKPQDAYVVGLLHDVGLLVVDQYFPDELSALLDARGDSDAPLGPLEEEHLGIDHGAVASLLIGRWQLPAYVADAIYHHNHPDTAHADVKQLAMVLAAAEAMTWQLDLGMPVEGRPVQPAAVLLRQMGVPAEEVRAIIDWTYDAYAFATECVA